MKTNTIYAALMALPLLLAATSESFAWSKHGFPGTRDQVRAACAAVGGDLHDGQGQTHCFNGKNGTGVSCYDDGTCDGSGPGPMPRVRIGMIDLTIVLGTKEKPEFPPVPESETAGSSDGSGAAPAASVPASSPIL